jgi:hypothetical protein
MVDLTRVPPQALEEGSGQSEGSYDPTFYPSGLPATTVQDAIDYLATQLGVPIKVDGNGAPTGDDDYLGTGGNGTFSVGSRWIDILNDEAYLCVFAGTVPTGGDAKWEQTTTNIASEIIYTPTLPQTATNVQDALDVAFGLSGTDLGNTPDADSVLITSSSGNDTDVPAATGSLAGVMTAADKTKLDGIDSGAQVNVDTNLGNTPDADSVLITSSTGTDTDVPAATGSLAGVMTAADKTKLDGIDEGASLFGQEYSTTIQTAAQDTNATTTLTVIAGTTNTIPSAAPTGHYIVLMEGLGGNDTNNGYYGVDLTQNGSAIGETHIHKIGDNTGPDKTWDSISRHYIIHHVNGGGDTVLAMRFNEPSGTGTAQVRKCRLTRWRIDDNITPTNVTTA